MKRLRPGWEGSAVILSAPERLRREQPLVFSAVLLTLWSVCLSLSEQPAHTCAHTHAHARTHTVSLMWGERISGEFST